MTHHTLQPPSNILQSIQSHKLFYSLHQLQKPVFRQVSNIINQNLNNNPRKNQSQMKMPKYKYLHNERSLKHTYQQQTQHQKIKTLPSQNNHLSYEEKRQRIIERNNKNNDNSKKYGKYAKGHSWNQENEKIWNPKRKVSNPQQRQTYSHKKDIMDRIHPKVSQFGISKFSNLEEEKQIERIHEKLDAYIKENLY